MPDPIILGRPLQLHDVDAVARRGAPVVLDPEARARVAVTRARLEARLAGGATIYGVNTGFGALSDTPIAGGDQGTLQLNLLRSHAMGVGAPLPIDAVRAILALRAHALALGASGVRPELLDQLVALLTRGVTPVVPSQGSVGASGDLAPLAHVALLVIGEGEAWVGGRRLPGAAALAEVGLAPLALAAKEGLALINGTQVTAGIGALALMDAAELVLAADILGALSLDANLGTLDAFDPRIHAGKPHPGQQRSATIVRELVHGSTLNHSHAGCGQVQDAYALRCIPQVHGAARGALRYVAATVGIELNSMTDNPLVLSGGDDGFEVLSGGNFHAGSIATAIDHMTASLTTLATISERRSDRFMGDHTSRGLPAFLAVSPGLDSGFMLAHVTAAALASECKSMSFPASVDTIPTSAGKEDHVSMGPIAARKLAAVVANLARVLAIEAVIAARALDLREHPTSVRLQAVHAAIRRHVAPLTADRSHSAEIEALAEAIVRGELREAAGLPHELVQAL
ncbi:MAG: histidine ammonia-lyase [Deltaproteobacteria bacterium]|nr:histidine ammonia-lyase [Nannocystaceae bacterium]